MLRAGRQNPKYRLSGKEDQDMISFAILGGGLVTIAVGTIIYGMCFA